MITNERQYRISKSAAEQFRKTLSQLERNVDHPSDIHPKFVEAQKDAIRSQLDELLTDLAEYDRLKAGNLSSLSVGSFSELASGLISARIAVGLSQKALAERLGLKEQQIQRYEAEQYASASYQRLQEIARAIGVEVRKEILLPSAATGIDGVLQKLRQAGISQEFLFENLLSAKDLAAAELEGAPEKNERLLAGIVDVVSKVYGWTQQELFASEPLSRPRAAGAAARFKMPARRSQGAVSTYTTYAHHLASICLLGAEQLPVKALPSDARKLRDAIIAKYGVCDLRTALHFVWDCGVPVLPLKGSGTFHGASWRYDGRDVIVLKQQSMHVQRWLFDLIHETFHAASSPERLTHEVLEADETSRERRDAPEEIEASQFAGDVILDGRSEELAEACVKAARGSVERLKTAVPKVAHAHRIDIGALANYMAFRLSWQGINWWGAAANLQPRDESPWHIARDVFLERFPFEAIGSVDRELLERALR